MNRIGSGVHATRLHTAAPATIATHDPRLPHDLALLVLGHEVLGVVVERAEGVLDQPPEHLRATLDVGEHPRRLATLGGRWNTISASRPTMIVSVWWR